MLTFYLTIALCCSVVVQSLVSPIYRGYRVSMDLEMAGFGAPKKSSPSSRTISGDTPCLCGSENTYAECCKLLHKGGVSKDAKSVVQARFSAFSLGLIPYIISSTSPKHRDYAIPEEQASKSKQWKRSLERFSKEYSFSGLAIGKTTTTGDEAVVEFTAKLTELTSGRTETLSERSTFECKDGSWLYSAGDITNPFAIEEQERLNSKRGGAGTAMKARGVPPGNQ